MPDVREKLVELQSIITCPNAICNFCEHFKNKSACEKRKKEVIADNMIANGVTIQRWTPVAERLPDKDGDYLVFKRFAGNAWSDVVSFAKDGRKVSECTFGKKWPNVWYYYDSEWGYIRTDAVTHWMPLPEPPKGE